MRSIAETVGLIQQNIQPAKQYKENILKNPEIESQDLLQIDVRVVQLEYLRTVYINEKCCQLITVNNESFYGRRTNEKKNFGCENNDIIQNLEQMIKDYTKEINLFKQTIKNEKDALKPKDIFPLVGSIYRLPINGKKIREQTNALKISQTDISLEQEVFAELSAKANSSTIMHQFKFIISN
ncbi:unnamed protein product, partial [Rotaria sordida]